MQPAQAITFRRGDFVLLTEPGAVNVGIVVQLRPGKVDVLWYEPKRAGAASTHGRSHDPAKLRVATAGDDIPDALWRLKQNL